MKKILWVIVILFISPLFCFAGFTDNGDGTITDHNTGLIWMQAAADTNSDGTADKMNWQAALSFCEALELAGKSDWRLPNVKELSSIVDSRKFIPAIDKTDSPATMSSSYWSSTTGVDDAGDAWRVYFHYGNVYGYGKSLAYYVRAVRGGQ